MVDQATRTYGDAAAPPAAIRPTPLHPLPEDALVLQDTRSSTDTPAAPIGHGIAAEPDDDSDSILPKRAPDEDAQAARDKLDRIAKAQQARRNWAKSTGVTLVAKAFGRNDRRQRRRRHGISSDEESSNESSSHEEDGLKDRPGEVKLMITGNPVVTRVFDAATRAKGRFRGQTESPEVSPQNEEAPFRFSIGKPGGSLARRFRPPSATPPPESALKASMPSPSGEIPPRASTDRPLAVPDRPRSRVRATLNPELLVVDEEGHFRHVPEEANQPSSNRPTLPFSRSNNSHTPTSFVSSTPSSSNNQQTRGSVSSFTGGPIHDEPDLHEPEAAPGVPSPLSGSSASSASSDDELDDSAIASDSDGGGDDMLKLNSLSLEHGESLTKEQLKRRKKLIRREIQRRKANGEPVDDLIHLHSKVGQLSHKVSSRVSKGIHYASSQNRNRRAMDRYSPHPMQLSLQTSDLPRRGSAQSSAADRGITPFTAISPSVSRSSNHFGQRRESVATVGSSRRSSMTVDEDDLHDADGASTLRRMGTIDRSILSSRNSIRKYLHAPNVIKRRRQRKWEAEMTALEQAAEADANKADPEAELDNMLAKYAAQQAPADATKVKYEFDVLYENQRGLLVFGIPKFSPRTLFQWDPSPWTSSNGKRSAYNIANAQLPDPSWEWAYHEWYIDMTGDVDEAGWQYSGNFGRRFWPNIHFPHGRVGMPKIGVEGIREMNARNAEKDKKRQEKEDSKEDGGFEAIKRTARARSSKWTGSPDAWTFVRRRRWIRLRRRKPLAGAAAKAGEPAPVQGKVASPAHELPVTDANGKAALYPGRHGIKTGRSDDEDEDESSFGGSDETDSSSEDDEMLYAPAYGRPSGFLPRRLPGDMSNGPNPARSKDPRVRHRARKHAREFTGTIRELKSLLPSIIAMDREAKVHRAPTGLTASQSSYKWAMLKINKVDARNPFISWHFVKHRLQDEDMAFAATTLRTMERKFQQRQLAAIQKRGDGSPKGGQEASHLPIPASFGGPSRSIHFDRQTPSPDRGDASTSKNASGKNGLPASTSFSRLQEPFAMCPVEGHELTREALVEINFARVLRVLRACKIDRQRMDLWKLWLGVISLDRLMETARREDLAALGLLDPAVEIVADPGMPGASTSPPIDPPHLSGGSSYRYRQRADRARARWRASVPTPDASDVWDVLERKLDEVLLLFEFQSNRAQLIRLLLTVHEKLHPDHVYRDRSLRANPLELSPVHVHGDAAEMGGASNAGGAFGSRLGGWKRAGLPRLEFFSDLQRILAALPGNDATTNSHYILSQPSPDQELDTVAMPIDHHHSSSALIDKLEAEALSDSFLDHEKIPSSSSAGHRDGAGIHRPASASGNRLSVMLPGETDRDRGLSRSPSPIPRAPSVPLPYRHSPLSSVIPLPLSQGSLSTHNRNSLSTLDRPRPAASAESSPPSTAPGKEADTFTQKSDSAAVAPWKHHQEESKMPESHSMLFSTPNPSSSTEQASGHKAISTIPSGVRTTEIGQDDSGGGGGGSSKEDKSGEVAETSRQPRSPRPPIPVRSDSVSPLTTSKDRF